MRVLTLHASWHCGIDLRPIGHEQAEPIDAEYVGVQLAIWRCGGARNKKSRQNPWTGLPSSVLYGFGVASATLRPRFLLSRPHEADEIALTPRISAVIATAHAQWSAMAERRRLRAFGFRPAVEPGVLKREWRDLEIRVSVEGITARGENIDAHFSGAERELTVNGHPFSLEEHQNSANALLDLIHEYERWVEAREGREGRIQRGRDLARDRRPMNALAETRRLQRVLNSAGRG